MSTRKRLYRSRKDRIIAGICGGLGEYFDIDPVWVRILFVLLALANGTGIILYLVLWIIVPQAPLAPEEGVIETEKPPPKERFKQAAEEMREKMQEAAQSLREGPRGGRIFLGVALIVLGILFLLQNLHVWWVDFSLLWPVLLIALGVYLLLKKG